MRALGRRPTPRAKACCPTRYHGDSWPGAAYVASGLACLARLPHSQQQLLLRAQSHARRIICCDHLQRARTKTGRVITCDDVEIIL